MPKRTDLRSILVIGSGPIVIGQAGEFDYSGAQACKVLRREGYRVILVNSNPATIMTDPEFADATYVEPLTVEMLEKIIAHERPDALLPTVGAQTALNLAVALEEAGVLARYGVQLIGANTHAIKIAEDRQLFKDTMEAHGLRCPRSQTVTSVEEGLALLEPRHPLGLTFPVLVRPSFTLGGSGGGVAHNLEQLREICARGLRESPVHQVLIEQSVLGWKEFELEVMRDANDNFVVVCSIENLDPMGVHTGDSITIAPAMTLTDKEYQRLRDMAKIVMRAVGVETGGSNVQFAVNPRTGEALVIEMNPRVSRSSALASKATGFPIAKIAALLAVGYTLDEIPNDITRKTPASFEPSLDYVVVKFPRWAFEKFPGADPTLGPQMKSVGEVMAIGRTFKAALQKAVQSLEIGKMACTANVREVTPEMLRTPTAQRLFYAFDALRAGMSPEEVAQLTGYDRWFVEQFAGIIETECELARHTLQTLPAELLLRAKQEGFSDARIAELVGARDALEVRRVRKALGIVPAFYRVDTCAAEFESSTPYLYSNYDGFDESEPQFERQKVIILGGGPYRIGQGIEFDYCCVHACFALRDLGIETIMINCNPETVSTDYDTADRLYFEPLTLEHVLNVWELESDNGRVFVPMLVQFGGQTPLNLAQALAQYGVPIWGTSPEAIALAEDRERFAAVLRALDIPQPENGTARSLAEAVEVAHRIGYPVLVRPSYVLGGRAMGIVYDDDDLREYIAEATQVSPNAPVLIDRYLEDAFEIDVDAVADGARVVIGGIMQHIEEAGVHSGDSACVLPPFKVSEYHLSIIRDYVERIGLHLGVRGLMNVQLAIKDEVVYVLEVNPRASRTTPFVSKATGVPLAKIAARVAAGQTLAEIGFTREPKLDGFFVKEVVLPFNKFPGAFVRLGPEMRSTGEVMGHASSFGHAFAKAEIAAGNALPLSGRVLISVNDFDKGAVTKIARDLRQLGFEILATRGTAEWLNRVGVPARAVNKASEGTPNVLDLIAAGEIHMVISTPLGRRAYTDGQAVRAAAIQHKVPLITTLSAAAAAVQAIRALQTKALKVRSLQEHHALNRAPLAPHAALPRA
ncbi:MAG: carbamoyl-phosphate synthase large subunit [Thermoflexales bacterium]|nr:carbamoyl-phosphate synthase large subunit [Thermoflexales bacterium]MCS7324462.1 carbamoyl-phosphate synthase large subunit [Thermoflexales bacterium]MDW8054349.1 carbamoyl-phosphate synthase large subunit [Anaerolineae bacterium]MDW8291489.1 carbamoyl-phosphate synthase large subunit [Anaerolineae bacterium]